MNLMEKKPAKKAVKTNELKVGGFLASGIVANIKKNGRKDLALIVSDRPARVAGMFTVNKVKAAPVLIDIEIEKKGLARGVIINSGNANACTGRKGRADAQAMVKAAEKALGLPSGSIMVSSTGVIGVPFPIDKVTAAVPALVSALGYDGLPDATVAIMTTDAYPKTAVRRFKIDGRTVTVAGIAKGAGMICPNMATMLAYIMTDANVGGALLKKSLKDAVKKSFNSIIVDNDMSTNDTVLLFANGASGTAAVKKGRDGHAAFTKALNEVALELAHLIVRDGEGATRFIEMEVKGAATVAEAEKGARTAAESFLVKTAFFGGDPNWGRIMAALGRAGITMDEDKADITFNGVTVVKNGVDTGREKAAAKAIKVKDVSVTVNLKSGKGSWKVWTTDLSYEYVKINSAYRT